MVHPEPVQSELANPVPRGDVYQLNAFIGTSVNDEEVRFTLPPDIDILGTESNVSTGEAGTYIDMKSITDWRPSLFARPFRACKNGSSKGLLKVNLSSQL